MDLKETWEKIEEHLREAASHVKGTVQVEEYLAHNELGLAWEDLKELADRQGVMTAEFWRPMAKAAGLMSESSYYHRT